jgi:hypothetical protein
MNSEQRSEKPGYWLLLAYLDIIYVQLLKVYALSPRSSLVTCVFM